MGNFSQQQKQLNCVMSGKDFIKSRVKISDIIKNEFTQCLGDYLKTKQQQSKAPFYEPVVKPLKANQLNPFKKSLTDWRNFYSQTNFSKSNPKSQGIFLGKENLSRHLHSSFSFTKSTHSYSNIKKSKPQTPTLSCRKIHSSFSGSHSHRKQQPFDPSITPFVLLQNIYESSFNNFEETKRAQTARIRHYYQKKAQKKEEFQIYDKLQSKIKTFCQKQLQQKGTEFIRSGREMTAMREKPIYQRKGKRIIMPNQYFKDLNKVRIARKSILKQYPVQIQK